MLRTALLALLILAFSAFAEPLWARTVPAFQVPGRAERIHEAPANPAYRLIEQSKAYLGVRYRRGGTSRETGLDCSGLVQNVFRSALGLDLPRTASDMARLGLKVGRDELQPGDLVFFNTTRRANSHVGIYVGDGQFLHAPSSGGVVRIETMNQRYWISRFNGARRLVADAQR
ncbi:MAG TPA: NlpC/P60 family protein [Rhodocyclaceae bacterium]|nr:NlpC/P60 family protein [Rhodocyclaceae bacterium]